MGVRPLEGQGHSGRGEEAWILRQGEACRRPRTRPLDGEGPPPSSDPSPPRARPRRHRRALTAQVGRPPEHAGALLGALLGVGGHGGAEALTVPTGVTGAGVMDTGFIEGLGVHLGEKPPCALVCTALMGQACPAGLRNAGPRGHPAPGPRHTTQGLATPGYADLSLGARGLQL